MARFAWSVVGSECSSFGVVVGFAAVAGVACFVHLLLGAVRFVRMNLEGSAVVAGCSACFFLVALVDPLRDFAAGASVAVEASVVVKETAVAMAFAEVGESPAGEPSVDVKGLADVEASVGACVAAYLPVAWMDVDVESLHSAPGIPNDPASIVSPVPLRLYASMCFRTWRNSRHPQGSGRPGYQERCPPTSRTLLAILSIRLDGLFRSNFRIPKSVRIAGPRSFAR